MHNLRVSSPGSSPKSNNAHEPAAEKPDRNQTSLIGAEITVTGNIEAAVDLHIEGRVVGDVRCETLILGESSKIIGNIQAARIRVSGTVEGGIKTGDLAVEATARVKGEVTYGRLRVANGGSVEGRLKCSLPAQPRFDGKLTETNGEAKPVVSPARPGLATKPEAPLPPDHRRQKEKGEGSGGQVEPIGRPEASPSIQARPNLAK